MSDNFIVTHKNLEKNEKEAVIMTIRLEKSLQTEYDKLSEKTGRSRNELMCMALRYALEKLEVVEK